MTRWIRDWFILSALVVMGAGMLFVFWAIWPLLPNRLPTVIFPTLDLEGVVAILMLIVILAGFGKLMCCK
ncbi:MAG TPA: hypothetical protein PKZ84_22225 [Anaerolineae bacterium]|nr:hypothetical protein [Anaerolineae bacterium]HQI87285.1 hypothetical protein [Anaerolineae bacterium]